MSSCWGTVFKTYFKSPWRHFYIPRLWPKGLEVIPRLKLYAADGSGRCGARGRVCPMQQDYISPGAPARN